MTTQCGAGTVQCPGYWLDGVLWGTGWMGCSGVLVGWGALGYWLDGVLHKNKLVIIIITIIIIITQVKPFFKDPDDMFHMIPLPYFIIQIVSN